MLSVADSEEAPLLKSAKYKLMANISLVNLITFAEICLIIIFFSVTQQHLQVTHVVNVIGLERFRIFTVRFDFDSYTLDSIFFESVL